MEEDEDELAVSVVVEPVSDPEVIEAVVPVLLTTVFVWMDSTLVVL